MVDWIRTTAHLYKNGKIHNSQLEKKKVEKKRVICPEISCDCPEVTCKQEYEIEKIFKPAPPPENITVYDHNLTVKGFNQSEDSGSDVKVQFSDPESTKQMTL